MIAVSFHAPRGWQIAQMENVYATADLALRYPRGPSIQLSIVVDRQAVAQKINQSMCTGIVNETITFPRRYCPGRPDDGAGSGL